MNKTESDKFIVLSIDDEPVIRESMAAYLEDSGFIVIQAKDGREGLDMFRSEHPDIILVDLRMPGIDGLEVLSVVTKESPETPIIVVSGTGVLRDAIDALRLGAWDYLIKPIPDMEILEHSINRALEQARLRLENRKYQEHLEDEIKKRTWELEDRTIALEMTNEKLKREVLERERTEEALRKSEKRYRALFEDSPISLWEENFSQLKEYIDELRRKGMTDFRTYFNTHPEEISHCAGMIKITDVNKATLKLYQADHKSEVLVSLNRLLSERSYKILKEQFIAVANEGAFEMECSSRTLKGNHLIILIKSSIPPGYEDTWSKVFISVYDLTERIHSEKERKKLEAYLRQAQKMEAIGALAGGIAHDFNNILFSLIGYTEITMDDVPKDSIIWKNLESMLKAGYRARDLVSQILTFSRKGDEERKPMRVQPIIKESLKLLGSTFPSSIKISQNIGRDCGVILANPTQIHQIMMNLCTNAYHAMRETGGVLEISLNEVRADDEMLRLYPDMNHQSLYLKLTVQDTGHGMSREVMEQIFDPYFTTKDKGEGTGLGLFVVYGIVKNHDGHIRVESEPGKGTAFHVWLPLIEQQAYKVNNLYDEPTPGGNESILLVDDEKQIVQMEQQILERLGYKVTVRTSSIEALEVFKNQPEKFDLVITDTTMPNMSGLELSKRLMQINPDIPIILCTGFSESVTEEKAKAIGIRRFVMKPVLKSELAKVIRDAIDSR